MNICLHAGRKLALDGGPLQTLLGFLAQVAGAAQVNLCFHPAPFGVLQGQMAAHALHGFIDDRQAQPRPGGGRAGGVAAEKGLDQLG